MVPPPPPFAIYAFLDIYAQEMVMKDQFSSIFKEK